MREAPLFSALLTTAAALAQANTRFGGSLEEERNSLFFALPRSLSLSQNV